MKNKKGFTLVELVIVIAVIAILAGVMIGTFASVVKKANESRKAQEMAAAKTEQTANDVIEKLSNSNWLGWEDFETNLVAKMTEVYKNAKKDEITDVNTIQEAVKAAVAEYYAKHSQDNTGLTAEQVKYIVETAVAKNAYVGVTAEQVKAIVNSAVSGSSTLTKSQVQAIVDKSAGLTVAEVAAAINRANTTNKTNLDEAVAAIKVELGKVKGEIKDATLSEDDIAAIVSKYVVDGKAKGDFTWYTKDAKDYTIDSADQLVALATVANGDVDNFADKTITLKKDATIELTEDWVNVKSFAGTLNGNGATIKCVKFDEVYYDTKDKAVNGTSILVGFNTARDYFGSKTAYGFINELKEGATLSNITIDYAMDSWYADPMNRYTYFGGAVGVMRAGAKLTNVHVTGTINAWGRCGTLVGAIFGDAKTEISDCSFNGTLKARASSNNVSDWSAYGHACGVVGYIDNGKTNIILNGVTTTGILESYDKDGNVVAGDKNRTAAIGVCWNNTDKDLTGTVTCDDKCKFEATHADKTIITKKNTGK